MKDLNIVKITMFCCIALLVSVSCTNMSGSNSPTPTQSASLIPVVGSSPVVDTTATPIPVPSAAMISTSIAVTPTVSNNPTSSPKDLSIMKEESESVLQSYLISWYQKDYYRMFSLLADADKYGLGSAADLLRLYDGIATSVTRPTNTECEVSQKTLVSSCKFKISLTNSAFGTITSTIPITLSIIDNQWKVHYWGLWKIINNGQISSLVYINNTKKGYYSFELKQVLLWTDSIILVTRETWKAERNRAGIFLALRWGFKQVSATDKNTNVYTFWPERSLCCGTSEISWLRHNKPKDGWIVLHDIASHAKLAVELNIKIQSMESEEIIPMLITLKE